MKRLREESYISPQFKRPFGTSRGESYGQPQNTVALSNGGGQKLTTDDALQYLKEVKEMFQDQRDKYDHFLEVMKDFKAQRIDTEGVIARVKELFKGHNNLIYGFNTFLPKGFEITMDDVEPPPKKVVEFEEAITFVNKIKKRFQDDDQVYKSFLDILNMYRKEHKNISEVYDEVSQLFEDHSDLLEEFTRFLPDNSSSNSIQDLQHARNNLQRYDERNTAVPISRPMHMDKRWRNRDRVSGSEREHDLSGERPEFDQDRVMMKSHKEQRKRDKENRDRRNFDVDDREAEHDNRRDFNIQHMTNKRKHAIKGEDFGKTPASVSSDDKNNMKSMYSKEFIFCEKVKEKLGSVSYQAFLKCLHIYSTEIITRSELQNLVADLLGKYPDLMEGFSEFLERCENIDAFLAGVMKKKTLLSDRPLPRQVKAEEKDKGPKREIDPAKEKANKEYGSKSIQELDLSSCERCSPSYRLLPDDYPIPVASQRSEIGAQVLNDFWVSVTSGSEDYSFKHMRRNQYEESLFKCEDDRFELDMLLESVSSTAKKVEDLLNSLSDPCNSFGRDGPVHIEEHFTPLNLRCVERLYGDHGLDVVDILRKNPALSLPVILTRLKQKQEEWTKCRVDYNKVWAEIYAKNHFKSLDHRSFYFKQQDSKNLSTKSLVAEIKEIKENMQKEDDMLLAVAAGNKRPLVPHFMFKYIDGDIHEDLFKLIKFSCEEICSTKDQLNKVMRLWTTFLEPMLGFSSRAHGIDRVEDVKAQQRTVRDGIASEMGRKRKLIVDRVESSIAEASRCPKTNSDTVSELNAKSREGSSSDAQPKPQNDADLADIALEQLPCSSTSPQNCVGNKHGRSNIESLPGRSTPLRTHCGAEDAQEAKFIDKTPILSNFDKKVDKLPSNCEVDEETSLKIVDGVKQVDKEQHNLENQQIRDVTTEDTGTENDVDVDEEDSENVSEGGDDVSGSESGRDECSREEQEEEEDVEHDEIEGKAESEAEAEVHYLSGDVGSLPLSERFLISVKPLAKYSSSATSTDGDKHDFRVFYGNDSFYALFRLHQMLYERILTVKTNSTCPETKWRNLKDAGHVDPYASFMTALYHLLDGSSDNAKFEDDCRSIIGNQSYVLFTLDKLIYKLVKQLQVVSTDEMESKLLQLYEYERSRKPEKFVDSVYHENARVLLHEDNIYRFDFSCSPECMSMQLMDTVNEKPEVVAVSVEPNFAAYLYNDFLSLVSTRKEPRGIVLQRNKNNYAGLDEYLASSKALEGVQLSNGLECKVSCSSSKISYVLDTEDFFFRPKRERKKLPTDFSVKLNKARVHRFNRFLSVACK